jgi:hypothetical protein
VTLLVMGTPGFAAAAWAPHHGAEIALLRDLYANR